VSHSPHALVSITVVCTKKNEATLNFCYWLEMRGFGLMNKSVKLCSFFRLLPISYANVIRSAKPVAPTERAQAFTRPAGNGNEPPL
jgi:hypothetical protein